MWIFSSYCESIHSFEFGRIHMNKVNYEVSEIKLAINIQQKAKKHIK